MSHSKHTSQANTVSWKSKSTARSRISNASKRRRREDYIANVHLRAKYNAAVQYIVDNPTKPVTAVARQFGVKYQTLLRRKAGVKVSHQFPCPFVANLHLKDRREAHIAQQTHKPSEEQSLVDWVIKRGREGRPVSQLALRAQAKLLSGKMPSRSWVTGFTARNPGLLFATSSGLDPRRAACFNPTAISRHFDLLQAALDMGICLRNIYNMDEQGIQFGGSRNKSSKRAFFGRGGSTHYRMRSDNLELVTVLDVIAGNGDKLEPAFVFRGAHNYEAEWFIEDRPFVAYVFHLLLEGP